LGVSHDIDLVLEDDLLGRVVERLSSEPTQVRPAPGPMACEDAPVTKKKGQHLLALAAQIPSRRFPCPHQIANGLMDRVWHPDRR